jgi:plastocyanin
VIVTAAAGSFALLLGACGGDDPGAEASTTVPAVAGGDPTAVSCVAGATGDEEVDIVRFTFDPATLEVEAGAGVTFTNQDATDHSVWSAERDGGDPVWESVGSDPAFRLPEVLHGGDASTCTFPAAGTYEYLCGVHNSMTGTIVVR